jgi:carbonic anhydrase/acetyltransferase-like protein (isoleucine patch superfamily)
MAAARLCHDGRMRVRLGDHEPTVDEGGWVAPGAHVIGQVSMGPRASVWYGASVRGDMGTIAIGEGSNVQDNATLHADPGFPVRVGAGVTIGHNAVVHGCTVEDDCLIGMGAIVLNGAVVGAGSLVAAGAVVSQGMKVPPGSLVAGVPAEVKRPLRSEELEHIRANAAAYVALAEQHSTTAVGD